MNYIGFPAILSDVDLNVDTIIYGLLYSNAKDCQEPGQTRFLAADCLADKDNLSTVCQSLREQPQGQRLSVFRSVSGDGICTTDVLGSAG